MPFALNHLSPIEALQHWRDKSPELFVKRVYKRAELDTYGPLINVSRIAYAQLQLLRAAA